MADPQTRDAYARRAAEYTSLLGYFEGPAAEPFPHTVTTAYHWSHPEMARMLDACGFDVLELQSRHDPGHRPHADLDAIRR